MRVGIPRVLNVYEDFPFWFTFFNSLGYEVILSDYTTKDQYNKAIDTIPSDTACYQQKLFMVTFAILANAQVDFIWYPLYSTWP